MWLAAAVDVEGCGGGVALVRAALSVGDDDVDDGGEKSWTAGERARLKDAIRSREYDGECCRVGRARSRALACILPLRQIRAEGPAQSRIARTLPSPIATISDDTSLK